MPPKEKSSLTQRAYTLRLRGIGPDDESWRDALWSTHEAVNKGAKAFGDWLLTLRGGLEHTLADAKIKVGRGEPDRDPTDQERKARRILLALSWLSVESKLGAPEKFIIASGQDAAEERNRKVFAALKEILERRNVAANEIEDWKKDCSASLSAAIREDAVWVNRSKAFDEAVKSGCPVTRKEVWDLLERFFGSSDAYLAPAKSAEDDSSEAEQEDKAKDLVQKAGQWLSSRFGTGKGADFCRLAKVYQKIAGWADQAKEGSTGTEAINELAAALGEFSPASNDLKSVLGLISGPGYKSATRNLLGRIAASPAVTQQDLADLKEKATNDAEKCNQNTGSKGRRAYSDKILKDVESVCGFTYLQDGGAARHSKFAVMLDHAARRVSLAHTWIKRAEAERKKFEEEAKKITQVPKKAKDWLDKFCEERSMASGAQEPYRIRRRAVDGWKEVIAAWSAQDCKTKEDRIAAARALQDDPEIDKFGDIQLFEALAEDDAVCVWRNGDVAPQVADPQPLIDYTLAAEAEFKKRQFKVPAYRHPDSLLHPIFCDFGESRWEIKFAVHEDGKKKKNNNLSRSISMTLWAESGMKEVPLCWQSKRLARDLALGQDDRNAKAFEVSRADRLGRAASNVGKSDAVKIAELFKQKKWNGRLQAPRQQLEAIARHVEKNGWDPRAEKMRKSIQWLVTFSARLQPKGPWQTFAKGAGLREDPKYWTHADENKKRKGQARLILSRLPGLRVLSVDLGHRYAAACAVWAALSAVTFKKDIDGKRILRGGTDKDALYCHIEHEANGKKHVTIYRRIGADRLPDGTPHPAPWARLDRQFLIKLQGEEEGVREASNEEIWMVHQMEAALGRSMPLIDRLIAAGWGSTEKQKSRIESLKELGWKPLEKPESVHESTGDEGNDVYKPSLAVDEIMFSACRIMRLGLKRHGDRARIAHYLIADEKTRPSGTKEKLNTNGRIELLQDALVLWHDLFSSRGWQDTQAKRLWDDSIARLPGYETPEAIAQDAAGSERKRKQKQNRERLYPVAKALAREERLCSTLSDAWKKRWEEDDEQWKKQLRWFKDWVLPRGKQAGDATIRKVGGLSLTRLATLTEFRRKIQVGFFTRLHPDGTKAEIKEDYGQSTLETLEHLREQRVKQLASRIVEAALGIGRVKQPEGNRTPKRPDFNVNLPCHAIVIEDLTRYRPEETRTRRENRQLMSWSAMKVKKYLGEACELYGLHLREVSAAYTSRQDSRTGAPGIRCQDVPVMDFMRSPFWRKQVTQAEGKRAEGKGDAHERFLCGLNAMWKDKTVKDWEKAGSVRVPVAGGEIFVSADPASPAAKGIQADLNAAANIGLRALTDPDWPGKWWYVPCEPDRFRPVKDKVEGSSAVKTEKALRQPAGEKGNKPEVVNLWRDVSSSPLEEINAGEWREYTPYQKDVQCRVVRVLEEQQKAREMPARHPSN